MSKKWRLLIGLTAVAATAVNGAQDRHPLSDIASTAAMEMHRRAADRGYDNLDVQVRPLDARLTLARCQEPLSIVPANSARALGAMTVGIACRTENPWTLYVRGQVTASINVPVLAGAVARGDILSKSDIRQEMRAISNDSVGIITEMEDIVGKEAKRSLAAGKQLRFSDLKAPVLVKRGQTVNLVSGGSGFQISMQGKALASGGNGDRVLVANLKTGKRLEGIVSSNGSVLIQ